MLPTAGNMDIRQRSCDVQLNILVDVHRVEAVESERTELVTFDGSQRKFRIKRKL